MGNTAPSYFGITAERLSEYEELTYLSRVEIIKLLKKFASIEPDTFNVNFDHRIGFSKIQEVFQELKYNPFSDRISKVFSSNNDDCFSFEDMLDFWSIMSENCPDNVKAAWAFHIFDFKDDGGIGEDDITEIIDRLTGNENSISKVDKETISDILLKELDIECNGSIGKLAFQHGVGKMSEFPHSFSCRS